MSLWARLSPFCEGKGPMGKVWSSVREDNVPGNIGPQCRCLLRSRLRPNTYTYANGSICAWFVVISERADGWTGPLGLRLWWLSGRRLRLQSRFSAVSGRDTPRAAGARVQPNYTLGLAPGTLVPALAWQGRPACISEQARVMQNAPAPVELRSEQR